MPVRPISCKLGKIRCRNKENIPPSMVTPPPVTAPSGAGQCYRKVQNQPLSNTAPCYKPPGATWCYRLWRKPVLVSPQACVLNCEPPLIRQQQVRRAVPSFDAWTHLHAGCVTAPFPCICVLLLHVVLELRCQQLQSSSASCCQKQVKLC